MTIRTARIGFLAIAILIAAFFPVREKTAETASGSEWERFSDRCASDSLRTLDAADADWSHVDGHYWTLKELYQMTSVAKPEAPGADRK